MPLDPNADCTVCIPAYNQAEHLRAAIESVANQTAPVRLIVSNDASTDTTAEVLAELRGVHEFEAINHPANLGISANLQCLLRRAETRFLVRLDSDDVLEPAFVGDLAGWLERYPQAGYAHCAIQEIDEAGRPLHQRRLARWEPYQDAETALRRSVQGYQVAANVLMFRRDALVSVDFGAASQRLNFVEDYDLSIRLADAGWGNVYCPELLARYRVWHASSRPVARRKLMEVQGLGQIFTGTLTPAFERRGWPLRSLPARSAQLALANSEILDRASFDAGERAAMARALLALSDDRRVRWAVGDGWFAQAFRRAIALRAQLELVARRWAKRMLVRR